MEFQHRELNKKQISEAIGQ